MKKVLVIGASGFVGRKVAQALLAKELAVSCLARNTAKIEDLVVLGCEAVQGDISDSASMQRAFDDAQAAYICVHTLSPQQASTAGQRFMDVETKSLQNGAVNLAADHVAGCG